VITKDRAAGAVIYGDAGNGKRRAINTLLIDDRFWHLWRRGHLSRVIDDHMTSPERLGTRRTPTIGHNGTCRCAAANNDDGEGWHLWCRRQQKSAERQHVAHRCPPLASMGRPRSFLARRWWHPMSAPARIRGAEMQNARFCAPVALSPMTSNAINGGAIDFLWRGKSSMRKRSCMANDGIHGTVPIDMT
jgi:hypothetical protein